MRLLWVSNAPYSKTGYGVQTNLFATRLMQAGHPSAVLSYYGLEGGVLNYNGMVLYPKGLHPYGMDVVGASAMNFGADAIFTLMDTWVITPQNFNKFPWIAWYPIDHENMPGKVREAITQAYARIAMSKHGVRVTNTAGMECFYIPHGVDTNVYKPYDKMEARKELKLPESSFLIGTVAMNKGQPSRKCLPQLLQAFANFKHRHKDAVYYLHTQEGVGQDGLGGVNIPECCALMGLEYGKDVILPNPYTMMLGFPDDFMAKLYSSFDVHLLVSTGEGFGVPIIEAQSCGCPVIVGDWTAMGELVYSGRKVDKKDAEPVWTGIAAYQYTPKIRAIELALEAELKNPSPRERARKGMVENYDAQLVFDKHFLPTINVIEQDMKENFERFNKGYAELQAEGK